MQFQVSVVFSQKIIFSITSAIVVYAADGDWNVSYPLKRVEWDASRDKNVNCSAILGCTPGDIEIDEVTKTIKNKGLVW